jgi:hypothetical protein
MVRVVGLVENIPGDYARIIPETPDDSLHVTAQRRGARDEVAADEPADGVGPRARALWRPDATPELRRANLRRCGLRGLVMIPP